MQVLHIETSKLVPNTGQIEGLPKNPRFIRDEKYSALVRSIQDDPEMLELRELIVYPLRGKYVVIAGNMRLRAIKEIGHEKAPCKVLDEVTPLQKLKAFAVKDNVPFGEHDWDALANEWDAGELADWGLDVPDYGAGAGGGEAQEDEYEMPDEIQTDIVLGDLFEIGPHRLLCGDSTKVEDVVRLLDKKEPYLMVTDPPYGVEYDANWRNEAERADGRPGADRATGKVNNDHNADWSDAWALSPAKVAYIWHADKYASTVQESIEKNNFIVRCQIIWVKSNIVFGRGDYHWKHEPCWYAVKKGNKGNWAGDRKQTTVWDIDKPMKSETGHSTQKPVECMARPIANHDGDVYDPFLGSGTTMVAAHQLGRKCYGMEISPKYCYVIVDRMLKLDPSLEIKRNGVAYKIHE